MKIYLISYDGMQTYECECVNPDASIADWDEITKDLVDQGFHESSEWIFNSGDKCYVYEDEYPEDTCWWVFTDQELDEEAHTPEEVEVVEKPHCHGEELIEINYTTKFGSHEISCDRRYYAIEKTYDGIIVNKVEKEEHLYTICITEEADRFSISTDRYWVNMPTSLHTRNKATNEIYNVINEMFQRSLLKEYKDIPLHVLKKALGLSDDDGPKIISLL